MPPIRAKRKKAIDAERLKRLEVLGQDLVNMILCAFDPRVPLAERKGKAFDMMKVTGGAVLVKHLVHIEPYAEEIALGTACLTLATLSMIEAIQNWGKPPEKSNEAPTGEPDTAPGPTGRGKNLSPQGDGQAVPDRRDNP